MRRLVEVSRVKVPEPVRSWPRWSRRIPTRITNGIGHGHRRAFMKTTGDKAAIPKVRTPHRTPRIGAIAGQDPRRVQGEGGGTRLLDVAQIRAGLAGRRSEARVVRPVRIGLHDDPLKSDTLRSGVRGLKLPLLPISLLSRTPQVDFEQACGRATLPADDDPERVEQRPSPGSNRGGFLGAGHRRCPPLVLGALRGCDHPSSLSPRCGARASEPATDSTARRPRIGWEWAAEPGRRQGRGVWSIAAVWWKTDPSRGGGRGKRVAGRDGRDGPRDSADGGPWQPAATGDDRPPGSAACSRHGRDHTPRRWRRDGCSVGRSSGVAAGPRRRSARGKLRLDSQRQPWHNSSDRLGLSELGAVTRVRFSTPGPHPTSESVPTVSERPGACEHGRCSVARPLRHGRRRRSVQPSPAVSQPLA